LRVSPGLAKPLASFPFLKAPPPPLSSWFQQSFRVPSGPPITHSFFPFFIELMAPLVAPRPLLDRAPGLRACVRSANSETKSSLFSFFFVPQNSLIGLSATPLAFSFVGRTVLCALFGLVLTRTRTGMSSLPGSDRKLPLFFRPFRNNIRQRVVRFLRVFGLFCGSDLALLPSPPLSSVGRGKLLGPPEACSRSGICMLYGLSRSLSASHPAFSFPPVVSS